MHPAQRIGFLITEDALEALEALYPARPPDPRDSDREIWMKAGERRLLEVLRSKFKDAAEESLQGTLYG